MLAFDYTVDLQLEDTLRAIDKIRSHILTLAQSPANERKLLWESMTIRTWATLALDGRDVPKHQVATFLARPTKPTQATRTIYAIRDTYGYIHEMWRANPKPLNMSALETIYTMLAPRDETSFSTVEPTLKELLAFLSAENAHPVIQASIAHLHILTASETAHLGLFARMVHYLLLTKYGYDLRGFATPERTWMEDARSYARFSLSFRTTRHMTTWLAFMAESMRASLETLTKDVETSRFHIEFPKAFWELSDRQKELLKLLESPAAGITNKKVAKRFRVSNITASRDLSRLTSLGLLYPHGKGRSVYYTKI